VDIEEPEIVADGNGIFVIVDGRKVAKRSEELGFR
jgi:hypothetical protein